LRDSIALNCRRTWLSNGNRGQLQVIGWWPGSLSGAAWLRRTLVAESTFVLSRNIRKTNR
jgi:hypothetical protein